MFLSALVIFLASILVPVLKIVALFYLVWSTSRGSGRHRQTRTALYRAAEFVGRWSMVDVFVVTVLVALVQFGAFMQIELGDALVAFAGVVFLTMLAAETFDVRLVWEERDGT